MAGAFFVSLAVIGNGIIFATGLNANSQELVPQGWEWLNKVVAIVWCVLFAGMATARWLLLRSNHPATRSLSNSVLMLIVVCWGYPYYTLGFQKIPGLVANGIVIILALWIINRIRVASIAATALIGLVVVWISLATVYVVKFINQNG